jgi:histone H3/H4
MFQPEAPIPDEARECPSTSAGASSTVQPLPISHVDRIAKQALPEGFQITKDARVALHKSVNIFLLMLSAAVDESKKTEKKRRTNVTMNDVFNALEVGGMGHYVSRVNTKRPR